MLAAMTAVRLARLPTATSASTIKNSSTAGAYTSSTASPCSTEDGFQSWTDLGSERAHAWENY